MFKKKFLISPFFLLSLAICSNLPAFAEHRNGEDFVPELFSATFELNSTVQNSWLRPPVKWAVSQFTHQVLRLERCLNRDNGDYFNDGNHGPFPVGFSLESEKDHRLPGANFGRCGYLVSRVFESFESVERYLYDTDEDFPHIYDLYRNIKEGLEQLRQY